MIMFWLVLVIIGFVCLLIDDSSVKQMHHTNADRIREMSDEELAEFIKELNEVCLAGAGKVDCSRKEDCIDCMGVVLDWLQSEVDY